MNRESRIASAGKRTAHWAEVLQVKQVVRHLCPSSPVSFRSFRSVAPAPARSLARSLIAANANTESDGASIKMRNRASVRRAELAGASNKQTQPARAAKASNNLKIKQVTTKLKRTFLSLGDPAGKKTRDKSNRFECPRPFCDSQEGKNAATLPILFAAPPPHRSQAACLPSQLACSRVLLLVLVLAKQRHQPVEDLRGPKQVQKVADLCCARQASGESKAGNE